MNRQTSNTFKYSNTVYTIAVSLYTKTSDPSNAIAIQLDPIDIEEVMYESRLNDLLLTGRIVYVDKYAAVDKMINQHFGYVNILFAVNKKKSDNSVSTTEFDEENKFIHNFIISDIKVLDRKTSIIKYQIDLVSMNWFNCISNIRYSNYDKAPEPIFDILKNCISSKSLAINDDQFDRVKSNVTLNYITQLNDNLFSVVKYLLHKLYYFPVKDDSIKFLVYDWYYNRYGLIDLKDRSTSTGTFTTILSFFKTNSEAMIQQEPSNIGSLQRALPKTMLYENNFEKQMSTYDFSHDAFDTNVTPPDQTVNYLNNRIDNGDYELKYQKLFDVPNHEFVDYGAYWNNQQATYNTTVHMLEESNAFILNVTGEIRRQPGSYTIIGLDRKVGDTTGDSKAEFEKMKQKYKAFEGVWLASKVRNIISPQKQTFRQQLVLFRNFIPKIEKVQTIDDQATKSTAQSAQSAQSEKANEKSQQQQASIKSALNNAKASTLKSSQSIPERAVLPYGRKVR